MTTADQHAETILGQIHADMREPFDGRQIPADVGSFSELHDFTDANVYLLDGMPQGELSWEDYLDLCNQVSDIIDRRLAAEAVELDTGERCECGRLIRFNSGHVVHIDDRRPCLHTMPVLPVLPDMSPAAGRPRSV